MADNNSNTSPAASASPQPATKNGKNPATKATKSPPKPNKPRTKKPADAAQGSEGEDDSVAGDAEDADGTAVTPKKKGKTVTGKAKIAVPRPLQVRTALSRQEKFPGVFFLESDTIESAAHLMAGYLKFETTSEFWGMMNKDGNIRQFLKGRKEGYGGVVANARFSRESFFAFLKGDKQVSETDVNDSLPPSAERWPSSRIDLRISAYHVVLVLCLMRDWPQCFDVAVGDTIEAMEPAFVEKMEAIKLDPLTLPYGRSVEDWNRGWLIIKFAIKNSVAILARKGHQNLKATKPDFLRLDELTNRLSEEATKLTGANLVEDYYESVAREAQARVRGRARATQGGNDHAPPSESDDDGEESDDEDPKYMEQRLKEMQEDESKLLSRFRQQEKSSRMPDLAPDDARALLLQCGKSSLVLWPKTGIFPDQLKTAREGEDVAEISSKVQKYITTAQVLESMGPPRQGVSPIAHEKSAAELRKFLEQQKQTSSESATTMSFSDACAMLSTDPVKPMIGDVELYAWQVTGIAWCSYMLGHALGYALLADDMGLGKTIQVLGTVTFLADAAYRRLATDAQSEVQKSGNPDVEAAWARLVANPDLMTQKTIAPGAPLTPSEFTPVNLGQKPPYKPTLILCPSNAFLAWKGDIKKYFPGIKLYTWFGAPNKAKASEAATMIGNAPENLEAFVKGLDPNNPETLKVCVLSAYATWHSRLLILDAADKALQAKKRAAEKAFDEGTWDDGADDVDILTDEQLKALDVRCKRLFGLAVLDECHKVKNIKTKTAVSISKSEFERILAVSTTPCPARTTDYTGQLDLAFSLLERSGRANRKELEPLKEGIDEYADARSVKLTPVNSIDYGKS
ncbi:hypothetical protein LTS18_002789 [Coniosporium uncinatum]|uniref:Uncharacterized protein n=1 Tax=Coniosporium uncinatum TaxID=93489 RepID=A0ACC3DZ07_9PEZI|nr:hypothetical protein LTS18_002789 [Coniosporium uncinatum]